MAKIKYSALVQEMRNKLNGSVLSKNRYGNYVRNKTTPSNPQTQYQQRQRALLSLVSQAWSGLSIAQRTGFATLASNHPFTNIFGDQVYLDGKAMFSKLSINLANITRPLLTDAPVFVDVPFLEVLQATASVADGIELTVSQATVPTGFIAVITATPVLPATKNFVKNAFRQLGAGVATANVITATSQYTARFGALTSADIGKRVALRVHLVSTATGQVSLASQRIVSVTV